MTQPWVDFKNEAVSFLTENTMAYTPYPILEQTIEVPLTPCVDLEMGHRIWHKIHTDKAPSPVSFSTLAMHRNEVKVMLDAKDAEISGLREIIETKDYRLLTIGLILMGSRDHEWDPVRGEPSIADHRIKAAVRILNG